MGITSKLLPMGVALLAISASVVVALGGFQCEVTRRRTASFQHLVGGLGFGPALEEACEFAAIPCPYCSWNVGADAREACHCPRHTPWMCGYPPAQGER